MCEDINVCKNRIGKNIDEIRRERKITIQKLSEKMGTSTVVISRHLNGKTDIRTNIVIKYAEALGCSPADFFKDTADRSSFSIETDLIHTYPYNLACAVFEPYGLALKGGLDIESYTAIECCLWSVAVVEKSDRSGISDEQCIVKLVVNVLCHGIRVRIGWDFGRCHIAL